MKQQVIAPDRVAMHFFGSRQENTTGARVVSPLIDPYGTIDSWPEGFFDQFDKDVSELLNW
ncbi:MAG: DUF3696 domain-containing protein [Chloroflexaceae bacterium]|nr:DUF3696 domain-containing protein [Chloroflexaceae bacterium]